MLSIAKKRKRFHKQALGAAAAIALAGCACDGVTGLSTGSDLASDLLFTFLPDPGALPAGVQLSGPGFDGDSFSAILPVRLQADVRPEQALEEILPVLRAIGFKRSRGDLGTPAGPLRLEPVDLAGLAEEVCRETLLQEDATSREVCAAMIGRQASPAAETAFQTAYGVSFAGYRDGLERVTYQYTFPQRVGGVPIEGAGVFAFRREGESLSIVHGALFNLFVITNRVDERGRGAVLDTGRRLLKGKGDSGLPELLGGEPVLVLLPGGKGRIQRGPEVPALRYAWRTLLGAPGRRESWIAWIDAGSGDILQLAPQSSHAVPAKGERWRRDPGLCATANPPCTDIAPFLVDSPTGGKLTLRLEGIFGRVDLYADDVYGPEEVEVPADSKTFFRDWIGKEEAAVCSSGKNSAFRQVHAYSHLFSLRQIIVSSGILPPFPEKPIQTYIDIEDDGTGSAAFYDDETGKLQSLLWFVYGEGFKHSACPDKKDQRLNGVHDITTLAHEMSHLSVWRLQERRPAGWCKSDDCQIPNPAGHNLLHSFADGLAFSYASINCFSGWTDKNWGGTDKTRYCGNPAATSEKGSFPRLAHVDDVLNPGAPGDHFPEHRAIDTGNYADGQIAAAALWEIRQGLRSKLAAAGTVELWPRLQRAIWGFGFLKTACTKYDNLKRSDGTEYQEWRACDLGLYQSLQDLETRMVEQWAAPPAQGADVRHTANKVLVGWAKAGIFLVPPECVDGNVFTKHSRFCPLGESGGDAVIDVDDRDTTDDRVFDGVTHPEVDWLKRGGQPPLFRVWTGPRFRFGLQGKASTTGPFACHAKLKVEVASNDKFTVNRWESGEISAFPSGGPGCYAEVVLPTAEWIKLRGAAGAAKVYYRVRTWSTSGGDQRSSTSPGAGTYNVPPPFVVVNDSGKP